jgi:uncharacterized protein YkwD
MARQLVLLAVLSVVLLGQFAAVCNGRAAANDDLAALTKRLRALLERNDKTEDVSPPVDDSASEPEDEETPFDRHVFKSAVRHHHVRASGLSDEQKKKVIEVHNKLRRGEGASDMHVLKYNDKLAQLAQEWADRCAWGHRPHGSFSASNYGFQNVGENIWAFTSSSENDDKIPEKPIQDWFDEKPYYNYDSMTCSKEPCGHYTAVTWSSTQEVGCGLTKCANLQNAGMQNANFFVCNYGPGGNAYGKKPFKKGPACSECGTGKFFCTNSLCDASCSQEQGGGKCECKANCNQGTKKSDCSCECNKGYTGVTCKDQCRDFGAQCGPSKGWPADFCKKDFMGGIMYDQVTEQCPLLCGKCVAKKRSVEEYELLSSLMERMEDEKK